MECARSMIRAQGLDLEFWAKVVTQQFTSRIDAQLKLLIQTHKKHGLIERLMYLI